MHFCSIHETIVVVVLIGTTHSLSLKPSLDLSFILNHDHDHAHGDETEDTDNDHSHSHPHSNSTDDKSEGHGHAHHHHDKDDAGHGHAHHHGDQKEEADNDQNHSHNHSASNKSNHEVKEEVVNDHSHSHQHNDSTTHNSESHGHSHHHVEEKEDAGNGHSHSHHHSDSNNNDHDAKKEVAIDDHSHSHKHNESIDRNAEGHGHSHRDSEDKEDSDNGHSHLHHHSDTKNDKAEAHDHSHGHCDTAEEDADGHDGFESVLAKMDGKDFAHLIEDMDGYLCELAGAQIRDGLHILGKYPEGDVLVDMLQALTRLNNLDVPSLREAIAKCLGLDSSELFSVNQGTRWNIVPPMLSELAGRPLVSAGDVIETIDESVKHLLALMVQNLFDVETIPHAIEQTFPGLDKNAEISDIKATLDFICNALMPSLRQTTDEITNMLNALNGEFVPAGPSGSPTRGMAHLLPTGRNFYACDPQSLPSLAAWEVGELSLILFLVPTLLYESFSRSIFFA